MNELPGTKLKGLTLRKTRGIWFREICQRYHDRGFIDDVLGLNGQDA